MECSCFIYLINNDKFKRNHPYPLAPLLPENTLFNQDRRKAPKVIGRE